MKFYFDESGRFSSSGDYRKLQASVVTGVAISERCEDELKQEYDVFLSGVTTSERKHGEPKGNLLTDQSRERFCDLAMTFAKRGLLISPLFVDMSFVPLGNGFFGAKSFAKHLMSLADKDRDENDDSDIQNIAEKFSQLSEPQAWRLHSWSLCLKKTLDSAIRWLCSNGHEQCWEKVSFEFDEVDARYNGLESEIILRLIHPWLSAYGRRYPTAIFEDIHTEDNPFAKLYIKRNVLDLEKILVGNIYFGDSRTSMGLQIADIVSNMVFRAIHSPENKHGELDLWKKLSSACGCGENDGLKLLYVSSDTTLALPTHAKYSHMFNR